MQRVETTPKRVIASPCHLFAMCYGTHRLLSVLRVLQTNCVPTKLTVCRRALCSPRERQHDAVLAEHA